MTQEEFYLFMEEFRRVYGDIAKDIEVQIIALIENEVEPHKAIAEVMKRQPPAMGLSPPLSELLVSATINGSGRKRSEFTKSMIKSMKEAVINQPWTPDNMGLSKRLHKINDVMRQALNDEIQKAMRNGTNWVDISRKIYSGYGAGGKLKKAEELPNYMKEILRSATKVIDDPEEIKKFREFIRKMQRRLERIQTPGLQAAYSELIHAAETGKEKAIKRAIRTALEERSRYYAERIARTELARAWADGFYAKTLPDEDVIAYKWKLSSNHPIRDICDFHATANLYGLGAGIYPKNRMPRLPAHPHCRCRIMEVFDGELDGKTRRDDEVHERGQKLLESLPPKEQEKLLGVEGAKRWREGDKWENRLVGWSGHETPQSRLNLLTKANERDIMKASYNDIQYLRASMGDRDVRQWYKYHDERISELIDRTLPIENQARQAHALRNKYRTEARELMADQVKRKAIDISDPNRGFDELLTDKMKRKKMSRDEALEDIIKTAGKTNAAVNKNLGLR